MSSESVASFQNYKAIKAPDECASKTSGDAIDSTKKKDQKTDNQIFLRGRVESIDASEVGEAAFRKTA